jgi:redox-sensitive bicupin YhaK (pirin superfamily)
MFTLRKASDRGQFDHGWLKTAHTFSFGQYYDNRHLGYRDIRVINDDYVQEGVGFPTHPHKDMEILTYILEGQIAHEDSMGNGSVIKPGDVQYMSAGTGVTHSEFNPSPKERAHLLQIWILPNARGQAPRYDQMQFPKETRLNQLRLVASGDGRNQSIAIRQDLSLYVSVLEAGKKLELPLKEGRHAWIQIASGELNVNGNALSEGDGLAVSKEALLTFETQKNSAEFLVFDLN